MDADRKAVTKYETKNDGGMRAAQRARGKKTCLNGGLIFHHIERISLT